MINLLTAVLVILPAYVLLCLMRPVRRCPKCKGRKVVPKGSRHAPCGRCKGHGRAYRFAARRVHRLFWENAAPWARQKLRDQAERRRAAAR